MKVSEIYMTYWQQFLNHGIQDPVYMLITSTGYNTLEVLRKNPDVVVIDPEDPRYNYYYCWAVATKEAAMWFKLACQDTLISTLTEAEMQQCLDEVIRRAFKYLDGLVHGHASPARFIAVDVMAVVAGELGAMKTTSDPMFLKAVRSTTRGIKITKLVPTIRTVSSNNTP